jgi:hypothetical protein
LAENVRRRTGFCGHGIGDVGLARTSRTLQRAQVMGKVFLFPGHERSVEDGVDGQMAIAPLQPGGRVVQPHQG